MWRAGGAAVVAAMSMWCGVASAATVITDPAGDANGLAAAGLDISTGPASDAARDLTKVVASSDGRALTVAWTTSAPVTQGPASTFLRLNLTTPKCPITLAVAIGGTDSNGAAAFLPISDAFDCPGPLSSEGYRVNATGSTVSVRFPYAALKRNGVPIAATTPLAHLEADTLEGTV